MSCMNLKVLVQFLAGGSLKKPTYRNWLNELIRIVA